MAVAIVPYQGWQRNVRLANAAVEVIATLEVGPRILSYRRLDAGDNGAGRNVLKIFASQMGGRSESIWQSRGGHRLWLAPEDEGRTYAPDNGPVEHTIDPASGEVTLRQPATGPWWVEKTIALRLDAVGSGLALRHTITNRGPAPLMPAAAPWAVTVMDAGGFAVIPQPPLGEHPRDLLPNRRLALWPYTDLTDPRLSLGPGFLTLRQATGSPPLKLGLAHAQGWVGYLLGNTFFTKTVTPPASGADYPDEGCTFETFTNTEMLELETLGALRNLAPGESAEHIERWNLHELPATAAPGDPAALARSPAALGALLSPALRTAGLLPL